MRIAVVSDTHDRYPPDLPGRLRGADEIWHLGDVCQPEVLEEFAALGPRLIVIRGNNDSDLRWPLERTLERKGVVFHLVHIPPRSVPKGAHVLLHGHTHVPRDEVDEQGVRWLNPGCISFPRAGIKSFAWLTLEPGRIQAWECVSL